MAITIYLNGKKEDIPEGTTIIKLLEIKKIRPEVVTVELNDKIIQRSQYEATTLNANDRLEFVYYMGGGYAF
jgi:thiamine biosynthesis protein ThiS